ncbi:MAG: MFS transporter, partial [Desulfurococcaceae archaeon]
IVYEGGRSISGAYLKELGSPPVGPALVGFGEFIGYALRFISGLIATLFGSSKVIWSFTILGYCITAFSIPLLGVVSSWSIATMLYVLDRVGKGLRAPSRDVVVAEVSSNIGLGKGFGIHELLDQLGAFIGPLVIVFVLTNWGYRAGFLTLAIPGIIAVGLVLFSYILYPQLRSMSTTEGENGKLFHAIGRDFKLYIIASSFFALGFMHWTIASYYLKSTGALSDYEIGLGYAIAMIVDALVAVPLGYLFDKVGVKTFIIPPILSLTFISLILFAPRELTILCVIPWGIIACYEESVMRAALASILEPSKRPFGYGLFGLIYGVMWAVGGYIYSNLFSSTLYVLLYTLITNLLSLMLYLKIIIQRNLL